MMSLQKYNSDSPTLFPKDPPKFDYTFKSPKQENSQIIELTIDLSHPSKAIIENPQKQPSDLKFLIENPFVTPQPFKQTADLPLSYQVSPEKSIVKLPNRNYKTNTHENPSKIMKSSEKIGKFFYTEPSHYSNTNKGKSHHIANMIYNLDKEIKAHTKTILDQNFSTAFTPNSKQTEEDFESQEICEANLGDSRKNTKIVNFFDSADTPCLITDLSKNVKYVNGGVGVKSFEDFNEFNEFNCFNEKNSFGGKTLEENPKKNQIKAPFSPILMIPEKNHKTNGENTKFCEVFKSLMKNLK